MISGSWSSVGIRRGCRLVAAVLGSALVTGCGLALPMLNALTPDSGYVRTADVKYGPEDRHRLDVYRSSARDAQLPTVVFIYGGAWRTGKRQEYEFVAGELARAGFDVVVPDYRLYPLVSWPAFVDDVARAVARVQSDAVSLLGHPLGDIVLMGHSSGAHSAAVLAASPQRWWPGSTPVIAGLVGIAGPYDLPLEDPEVAPVFAGVSDTATLKLPGLVDSTHPPTLLIHGTDDTRVKPAHSERYASALRKAGIPMQLERLAGTGHAGAIAGFAAPLHFLNDVSGLTVTWLEGLRERAPASGS